MYNGKIAIASALTTDAPLIAMIPSVRMFDNIAIFATASVYPYLTYEELYNTEGQKADNTEIESEVTFRIHLWGTASLSAAAGHVNRIMQGLEYSRNYSRDLDELLETGTVIKHKVMSFSGNFTA